MSLFDVDPLNVNPELFDLRMSEGAKPLLGQVRNFIDNVVEPITEEFFKLGEGREDPWSYVDGQLELLEGCKDKAKAEGLWNFFLPDADTGEGLKNLDYAYIAAELGKNPLASETLNCSAPDTGNMEVLERVGTEEQKEQWLKPSAERRDPLGLRHDRTWSAVLRRQEHRHAAVLDGDEWVINGEKFYISGAGDPRCKIMITMVKTNPDAPPHRQQSQILVPMDTPGVERRSRAWRCSATTTRPTATCTSSSTTCGCRRRTCSSARAAASRSPRCASARVASTTACAPSVRPRRPST